MHTRILAVFSLPNFQGYYLINQKEKRDPKKSMLHITNNNSQNLGASFLSTSFVGSYG